MHQLRLRPARSVSRPSKSSRPGARPLLPLTALLAAVLIAACGSSATHPTTSSTTGTPSVTTTTNPAASSSRSDPKQSLQAYARCMRTHGVPNFKLSASPTGSSGNGGGGKQSGPYGSPSAAMRAVQAAHKVCEKYEPAADRG